ncbi:unnamed protein product [Amoebophrya sp. A25]|nr:unnamed protein product [Amoebophrya sp. A25]|eukprot:GSA25T00012111001.1
MSGGADVAVVHRAFQYGMLGQRNSEATEESWSLYHADDTREYRLICRRLVDENVDKYDLVMKGGSRRGSEAGQPKNVAITKTDLAEKHEDGNSAEMQRKTTKLENHVLHSSSLQPSGRIRRDQTKNCAAPNTHYGYLPAAVEEFILQPCHAVLFSPLLVYIERCIDTVCEQSAIDVSFFLASAALTTRCRYLLRLVMQKVGLGTVWERQKRKVFTLWIAQLMHFPHLDTELPGRCLTEGLRHWTLFRTNNQEIAEEFATVLKRVLQDHLAGNYSNAIGASNVPIETQRPTGTKREEKGEQERGRNKPSDASESSLATLDRFLGRYDEIVLDYYFEDSPYSVDIFLPRQRLGIVFTNEVSRNSIAGRRLPVGGHRLQALHIADRGYKLAVVSTSQWRALCENEEPEVGDSGFVLENFVRCLARDWNIVS